MSKLDKALGALRAVVKGIPEEMIDTHIRKLLDFCERTIEEIDVSEIEHEIVVVIEGGMCVDVRGLPEEWDYAIEDYDVEGQG
tara:strand:+ start:16649 stop:16897 length:249 start_codon:yes stop_codon:yes gene_type:complete